MEKKSHSTKKLLLFRLEHEELALDSHGEINV